MEELFIWLYSPLTQSVTSAIQLCQQHNIPYNIKLYKLVQHMLMFGVDVDSITTLLKEEQIITEQTDIKSVVEHWSKYVDKKHNNQQNNEINEKTRNLIIKLSKKVVPLEALHDYYPLPHPEFGRPMINWLMCAHNGCHKTFKNGNSLIKHLEQFSKYTPLMHNTHDMTVRHLELTPEKVLESGLTKCPSIICTEGDKEFTPEELCEHFTVLGIEPFWRQGMEIKHKMSHNTLTPIFTSDECVVCLDSVPEIVLYPCYHHILCINCVKLVDKCPICRLDKIVYYTF